MKPILFILPRRALSLCVLAVILSGCATPLPQKPFIAPELMSAGKMQPMADTVSWTWEAPVKDMGGNPLDGTLTYEVEVNNTLYPALTTVTAVPDEGGVQITRVRARADGGPWSAWSKIASHRFPELSINSGGVSFVAAPPLNYSLLWTSSLLSDWEVAKTVTGNGQTETHPLTGSQGFFKLEGQL